VIVEHRSSFTSFLTSVCAIVGGVFTVAGLVDSIYYTVSAVRSEVVDEIGGVMQLCCQVQGGVHTVASGAVC
jgi:hypothetical protein